MLINMESYPSDALDSEIGSVSGHVVSIAATGHQRGDGRSSSSSGSSEESIKSSSSATITEESGYCADVDTQQLTDKCGVGGAICLALAEPSLWLEHNEGYVRLSDCTSTNSRPLHDLPLAPRQQPDGCSISSSSSHSSLLQCSN